MQKRQGDLLFRVQSEKPTGLKPYDSNILAYGEATGHSHKIRNSLDNLDMAIDPDGNIWVRGKTKAQVSIDHEEHGTIKMPGKTWFNVTRQRQLDVVTQQKTVVAD